MLEFGKFKNIPMRITTGTIHMMMFLIGFWIYTEGVVGAISLTIVSLFVAISILAHELGHAFAAKAFGYNTHEVVLMPLGGYARLECADEIYGKEEEFYISAAGPMVNFALAGMLIPFAAFNVTYSFYLMSLNVLVAIFNLLPAFPMDGGRMLRAVLSRKYGLIDGTIYACKISYVFCASIVALSLLLGNMFVTLCAIIVGTYLIYGCRHEEKKAWKKKHQNA